MIEPIIKLIKTILNTHKKFNDAVCNSIMGYDNFIKQVVFELCYNRYISINKE